MAVTLTVSDRILEVMRRTPDCRLDDLVQTCQDFPWQAVLFEVNRLSREGQLQVSLISARASAVRLVERESPIKVCEGSGFVRGG